MKKMLLISNSTNYGEEYLSYTRPEIKKFLNSTVKEILFVPFAGVTVTYDDYTAKVEKVFNELGYQVKSIHNCENMIEAVNNAECIVVGGGNTFHLVHMLHKTGAMKAIKDKVSSGTLFIGWSAGSNVACPSLKTTNDMPIIEPASFDCMNLVPFQINPHYMDYVQPNHGGETREQRLAEFMAANPEMKVVGLRESSMLLIDGKTVKLIGSNNMRYFQHQKPTIDFTSNDNLDFLLLD
ncbi:MAG: dipeptidase PepE [Bacteroidetes bacterium]|nr:dipeptidase PepE [Bacteroidota bacterium]